MSDPERQALVDAVSLAKARMGLAVAYGMRQSYYDELYEDRAAANRALEEYDAKHIPKL